MKWAKGLSFICVSALLLSGCSSTVDTPLIEPDETEVVETGPVRPQDDYYRYVNGETLADAEFMYGRSSAADASDSEMVTEQVNGIILEVAAGSGYQSGTEEYLIQNLYNLYMDYDFANAPVPEELDQLFREIDSITTVEELLQTDARVYRDYAVPTLFGMGISLNLHGQYDAVLVFPQISGVLNADFAELLGSYNALDNIRDYSSDCLQALGHEEEEADQIGTDLAYLALDVFEASDREQLESSDRASYYQSYSYDQITGILTNVDFESYLTNMGVDTSVCDEFGIYDPGQLTAINGILVQDNLEALKALEIGKIMDFYRDFVYQGYEPLHGYASSFYGDPSENALSVIRSEYGSLIDPLYVEQYYDEETDEALRDMCDDIMDQYRILITNADWLTEDTRQGLLNKLDNMIVVTGADVERLDATVFDDVDTSSFFTFMKTYRALEKQYMAGYMNEEVPRTLIQMRMFEVNACYVPSLNNITICVASTNEPFFGIDNDYYSNLGGLGSIIAHEIGHAFDSNCILYDENGVYDPSWIAPEDIDALNARNEQAVSYFEDNFIIFGIYHVDGEQTLGENYADLGGLEAIAGIPETEEQFQTMFEAYARSWCSKVVDEGLIEQIASDEHSPDWIRVNAMLSTLDAFYETYDVQEGDGMYIPPENRITRWY